ncbi:MAG: tetratricopeptide repeat protein, partial [Planctomycetes bacterium]|nr:tetratricopeptide repeat protein [Planctomycetota bacterium]
VDQGWLEGLLTAGEMGDVREAVRGSYGGITEISSPRPAADAGPYDATQKIIRATLASWERATGRKAPEPPAFTEEQWCRIQVNTGNRPLYLQMAAIHACEHGRAGDMPAWGRGELLHAAVRRERDYIRRECPDAGMRIVLERILGLLCLTGLSVTHPPSRWARILKEEIETSFSPDLRPLAVEEKRVALFPPPSEVGGDEDRSPLEPDILSAAFVATLLGDDKDAREERLSRALDVAGVRTWPRLLRLVQDVHGVSGFEDVAGWLDPLIESRPPDELREVARQLPEKTVSLRRFAVSVYEALLARASSSGSEDAERAWLTIKLSTHLERLGGSENRARAVDLAREAVEIYERLAAGDQERHLPGLGLAYHYLGRSLGSFGRPEEELGAYRRAVEIRERLAAAGGEQQEVDLVRTRNNLGILLRDLGRTEESIQVHRAGLETGEALLGRNREIHAAEVAPILNNLAIALASLGRLDEALPLAERSVTIREACALRSPDEFAYDLTLSLSTLLSIQEGLGMHAPASETSRKSVAVHEELAARNPDLHLRDLARAMSVTAESLRRLGREGEAHGHSLRELRVRRRIARAEGRPSVDLVEKLIVLARTALDRGGLEDAADAAAEALDAYAEVSQTETSAQQDVLDRMVGDLAGSDTDLVSALARSGRTARALDLSLRAESLLEGHSAGLQSPLRGDMARILNNSAYLLSSLGRPHEALPRADRSISLWRESAARGDGVSPIDVARSLDTLACVLRDLDRIPEAVRAARESVRIMARIRREDLATRHRDLGEILRTLGGLYRTQGKPKKAVACLSGAARAILPHVDRSLAGSARLAAAILGDYKDACRSAGVDADADLVASLRAKVEESGP